MQSALRSSWSLFLGILFFMVGNGLQVVLIGVQAESIGFSDFTTGIVMSGYYAGFLAGSLLAPKMVAGVGHVRVFGALSAVASAAILIHPVSDSADIWFAMRILTGFAYSGMYVTAESWINDRASNATRGTLLSVYMVVMSLGMVLGQVAIAFLIDRVFLSFVLISVLISLSVTPILLSAAKTPDFDAPEPVSLARIHAISPLAFYGMIFNGLVNSIMYAMAAVYATRIGMPVEFIGLFAASVIFGALVLQYPIGKISDIIDRRTVIFAVQILATLLALFGYASEGLGIYWMIFAAFMVGGTYLPLYSLYIAHANDFLNPRQIVGASSMLVMLNGIGAIGGAPLVGWAMNAFGTSSFYLTVAAIQMVMTLIVAYRMLARESLPNEKQSPFVAMPDKATAMITKLNPRSRKPAQMKKTDTGGYKAKVWGWDRK